MMVWCALWMAAAAPAPEAVVDSHSNQVAVEDDEIVLEDDPVVEPEQTDDDIVLDDDTQRASIASAKPNFKPSTVLRSSTTTALGVDSEHNPATLGSPEDVAELWSTLRLQMIHRSAPGRSWRVGARLRLWGGWDHPDEGGEGKSTVLTELTELRYDRRFGAHTVLQFGLQKVDWSVTDGMGPSVMFAPRDLRFGLVGEPEDLTLPVEAIVARYTMDYTHDLHLEFAFVPRHRPLEMRLWGNDWGTASPDQAASLPIGDVSWLFDPSVEDQWQSNLFYFAKPEFKPEDFSGALRLRGRLYGAELGLWGFYGFDSFPELKMDPDLAAVLSLLTMMGDTPLLEQLTPERLAALERFQAKMVEARAQNDGSSLLTSTFHRLAQIGAQARRNFGPYIVAVETAWTPRFLGGRTLFSPTMQAIQGLATLHTAVQVEYQAPPGLIAVVGVSDFIVFDVPNTPLMLLDTSSMSATGTLDRPFDPDSSHLVTINGALKGEIKEQFEWVLAGVIHPFGQDGLLMPSIAWLLDAEGEKLQLSAEIFVGSSQSMFGRYDHNDRIVLSYKRSY